MNAEQPPLIPAKVIEEKTLNVCAAGRILLRRNDGSKTWLQERELFPLRSRDDITYRYIGTEYGIGFYHEV